MNALAPKAAGAMRDRRLSNPFLQAGTPREVALAEDFDMELPWTTNHETAADSIDAVADELEAEVQAAPRARLIYSHKNLLNCDKL